MLVLSSFAVLVGVSFGASVGPGGYNNTFTNHPAAADWASLSIAGGGGDAYTMDTDVNTGITAGGVTAQTVMDTGNPAAANALAVWSSSGTYVQLRPTGNRYSVLMAKFVNNTGTNATEIGISYLFTVAGNGVVEEPGLGTRVYYSLSGLPNSWVNLPTLNSTASALSGTTFSTNVAVNWTNGGSLFVLWADDNANTATDSADEIDDFSLKVTAGAPLALACAVQTPAQNALYVAGTAITATATASAGTPPYTVQIWTNSGVGNTVFQKAITLGEAPYTVSLGNLVAGTYNIYAVVFDEGGGNSASLTNTFSVANPISFALTSPANEASIDASVSVDAITTVAGGTPPYSVQFYLDNVASGAPVTVAPYSRNLGKLFVGNHSIRATVTDSRGWSSNSPVHTVHITGALGVVMTPTNSAAFLHGQPVTLAATAGGGTAPYGLLFYVNGQAQGTRSAILTNNLGVLAVGSYTSYVHATDSSIPAQQAFSPTNIFTITPNPLTATLTSPANGASVTANAGVTIAASASVIAPVTIAKIDFYLDGILVGSDSNAPYSAFVSSPTLGSHTMYAVAQDSLGRTSFSATNSVTFISDPLANNNFANRIQITGASASVTGANAGATTESGEPTRSGFWVRWGATLWWTWTAPVSAPVQLDTFGSSFNTYLAVYTGSAVNALTSVAANDNAPNMSDVSLVTFNAQKDTQYHIQVSGVQPAFGGGSAATGNIRLNLLVPPSVTLTAPANGAVLPTAGGFTVSAAASSPNGAVEQVSFYAGSQILGADTSEPFSIVAPAVPAGSNRVFAVLRDSAGATATSAVANVLIANPGITLTTPQDGNIYQNVSSLTVSAYALPSSGTITNVDFFVDGQLFGSSVGPAFSATWTNVTGGSHRFTAVGRTASGVSFNSQAVNIGVATPLMAFASVWKYLDDGSDQGTSWVQPNFNDSGWASGPAPLGYSDSNGRAPATTNSFGADANAKYPTTYYRHAIVISNPASYQSMMMNIERDDGAIVYINGTEVGRFNMPSGAVNYTSFASDSAGDDGATVYSASVNPGVFVTGTNVVAVEIHQNASDSSDIWFQMQLVGIPAIVRNAFPEVALTSPTNSQFFLAPASVALTATASDADGSVSKVEFFVDGTKIGEDTTAPYTATWNSPSLGAHELIVEATDDLGGSGRSVATTVTVYDAAGRPAAKITSLADGATMEGPTNLLVTAVAQAITGVTNVQFLSNGVEIGNDASEPYSVMWSAPFGNNALVAIARDASGVRGTSAVVRVVITIPPTNTIAPTVVAQVPTAAASVTNLTSVQVTFSERVIGVNASDLLINGVPASAVTGTTSNYTFTFAQPAYGTVNITWAPAHGITDVGYPANLAFNASGAGATWSYTLLDRIPPVVLTKAPVAGATLTNLTEVAVTFSETVTGVDASDFLVNGTPALGVTGSGTSYTFSFSQPGSGNVNIAWAGSHGIADGSSNPFNAVGTGATWSYTLDLRVPLVQSNSMWMFVKGTAEASTPIDAWRQLDFDDSSWSNSAAPFFFGDPYSNGVPAFTLLSDMQGNYSTIYLRKKFNLVGASGITNLYLTAQSDDGFVAWINGVEVYRYNAPAGDIPYNGVSAASASEPQVGVPYISYTLENTSDYLVDGENVLAVHALNQNISSSTDFGFNAQLSAVLADPKAVSPAVVGAAPASGSLFYLTNITIRFTEGVGGVDAADLLINGVPATGVSSTTNTTYTFRFAQPAYGPVAVTWAANHGIVDFDSPPKPFNATAPSAVFNYSLVNPSAPTIASQSPMAGTTIDSLTQIGVTFTEAVMGVDAADLRVNGVPATGVSGGPANYVFSFPQPAYGAVAIDWAASTGITDTEAARNAFDGTRPGNSWSYTLVDQTPPMIASQSPAAGQQVTNLTRLTVTFTEPVNGVNATDLQINGVPASSVSGSGTTYTFEFAQPNATMVNVTWAPAHGIRDLAITPNTFDANASGSTWFYMTPDNVAPTLVSVNPPAGATVRSLLQIAVMFTEPVTGLDTNDLLLNGGPARQLSGSGAGPYTFSYPQPSNGPVAIRWSATHGITDLATPANPFIGTQWAYQVDPNASFVEKVIISEIMFNPIGGRSVEEWVELHNVSPEAISLGGWRFTRGVDFLFPAVSIPAGGYLVVAADLVTFRAKYPEVTNVVGGWTGRLADNGETIEIQSAQGETVDSVSYSNEGDWARRERGHGAGLVERITRSGATATVSMFGHNYTAGDRVMISGADQPEYNGIFNVGSAASATFTISVSGTPASPATGRIICRQVVDNGASGWTWFSGADAFGNSLELVNAKLPNTVGQNWLTSTAADGTPGRANSVMSASVAPFIQDVTHFPAVPRSTDSVTITARVSDDRTNGVQGVTLFYRNHSTTAPGAYTSVAMLDDGAHNDGAARDGLYGATLAPAANRNVMEFYVQAMGSTGLTRTWPAPTWETNNTYAQLANALYQVDDETSSTNMPFLRVVMTETERSQLNGINTASDAEMNATFVSMDGDGTKVRYASGIRLRGAGSRDGTPKNFRVNVPSDNPWNGRTRMNLNSRYVHAQLAGSVLAQRAGLPRADVRVVQVRINGQNLASPVSFGCYVLVEPVNGDLVANHFPLDSDGNVYRGSKYPWTANLDHLGTNAAVYHGQTGAGYYKTSNRDENDWTDLFRLTSVLSSSTPDADYVTAVRTNVNVEEWMLYFMVCNFFDYQETSLCLGVGDDYAMYRGLADPRFILIAHDFDTILNQGDTRGSATRSIWEMVDSPRSTDPTQRANFLTRFMRHPEFAPIYFKLWKQHMETTFAADQVNPLLDEVLGSWVTGTTVSAIKTFLAERRAYVLTQIPTNLTVSSTLATQNGYFYTTSPNVTLNGQSHIVDTRRVLVNGAAASWTAWQGRWTNTVALQPGVNRVLVQSLDSNSVEIASATVDIWYDDSSVQSVSGAITGNTTWSASGGPFSVTANLTVNAGSTLTIQPGTTVYLASGVNITVANGGTLIATGTATAPIRFTRTPGTTANWGGITINGGANSPESRIGYAHFEGNGSTAVHTVNATVFLDHLTFGNTAVQYLSLDGSSFVVQDCVFPSITGSFEPVHGSGGIKAGGRAIFLRNFFGAIAGYNDTVDFTGGHRPGPIVQFINNVFMGSGDDNIDLDNTDAWIEGNIFLHVHKNGSPDTSSAISGGSDTGESSDVTIVGNIFYDCDHAALAKQGNYYSFLNNTIVRQSHLGGLDTEGAVMCLADNNMAEGAGAYFEGNILFDIEGLLRDWTNAVVTFTNNLMPLAWTGPGGNNSNADPLFRYVPQLSETTNFTNWASAQVMKQWFSLRAGSPGAGTGPNGLDKGAVVPFGVSVAGVPALPTRATTANLAVGVNRAATGMTAVRWPNGSGFTHYKWRLDAGVWSAETSLATPITLSGLGSGPHFVEVVGKNDAGFYQDDPVYGSDSTVTTTRTWVVDPAASPLSINEVLASNGGALNHQGTTPDAVELFNASDAALSLAGMRFTDDPANPDKFIFPAGANIPARSYLVVFANNPDGTAGHHLGFTLSQSGGTIYLYASGLSGGAMLDSVSFGPQLTDLSIGRMADGAWTLTVPTLGAANRAASTGDPGRVRLNEWLAIGVSPFNQDFIELYNLDAMPVNLGGLYISDEVLGWRNRHQIAPLSFIAGNGFLRFFADGDEEQGAEHLSFGLSGDQGAIGLYRSDLTVIDQVTYLAQWQNVSQGRSPNGANAFVFFDQPTPGAPNPLVTGPAPNGGMLVINEVLAQNSRLAEGGRLPDWVELYNGTATNISLAGMSLTDDTLQPRRFVFPAGVTIASGGYLRVLCDPGATNVEPLVNTNFGIKVSGGSVYLFDAPAAGGSLISAISFGLQITDFSIGRVPDGSTNWFLCSPTPAVANRTVTSMGDSTKVRINEIMADPVPGNDDWFELYNPDPQPVAIGGLYLTDDLNARTKHRIAPLSFLGSDTNAWTQFIADGNTGSGADHVGFSLRAGGEAVGFFTATGTAIDTVVFGQQQQAVSQGRFPDGATNIVAFPGTESPGASNWRRLTNIVINEVLTHTDEPLEDAIELHNLTGQPVDVGGWWLSDDRGTLQKYRIPSPRVIPAYGFTVIYENQFTNRDIATVPFALSSRGDEVVLSAFSSNAYTGWRTAVDFGAAANAVSFGRYVTSDGREEFVPMQNHTFGVDDPGTVAEFRTSKGATNSYPRIGPVVVSEIMYHPPNLGTNDNTRDEFVELYNLSTAPVALADGTNGWRLRNAVDFDFPAGTVLQPGEPLLVVGFDPVNNVEALNAFRAAYHLDASVTILGPWNGKLANDTDDLELRRPDVPDLNGVPYLLVERVRYADTGLWPAEADGTGHSLQRVTANEFANDPANWVAATPTPGPYASTLDADQDGMPNDWELQYGFDPHNPSDADLDSDGDRLTNILEYMLGTNPRNASSGLTLNIAIDVDGNVVLSFSAIAGVTYEIQSAEVLGGAWKVATTYTSEVDVPTVRFQIQKSTWTHFYRLRLGTGSTSSRASGDSQQH